MMTDFLKNFDKLCEYCLWERGKRSQKLRAQYIALVKAEPDVTSNDLISVDVKMAQAELISSFTLFSIPLTRLCEDIATLLNQEEPDYMRIAVLLANHDDRVWQRFRWLAADVSLQPQCNDGVSLATHSLSNGYDRSTFKRAQRMQGQFRIDLDQNHNRTEHKYYQLRAFLHSDVGTTNIQYRINEQLYKAPNSLLRDRLNLDPKPIITPKQLLRDVDFIRRNHDEISNKTKLDWSNAFSTTTAGMKFRQINADELLIVPEHIAHEFNIPKRGRQLRPKMRRIYRSTRELVATLAVLTAGQRRFKIQTNDTLMSEGVFNPETAIMSLRNLAAFIETQNSIVNEQLEVYQRRQLTKLNFMFVTSNQYAAACQVELIASHVALLKNYAEALSYFGEQYDLNLRKYSNNGASGMLLSQIEADYDKILDASNEANGMFRRQLEKSNKKLQVILQRDKSSIPRSMPRITSYKQLTKRLSEEVNDVNVAKLVAAVEAKMPINNDNILHRFVGGEILGLEEFTLLCGNECENKKQLQRERNKEHQLILDRVCVKIGNVQQGAVIDKYVEQALKYFASLDARKEQATIVAALDECSEPVAAKMLVHSACSPEGEWQGIFNISQKEAIKRLDEAESKLFEKLRSTESNVDVALDQAYVYAKKKGLQSYTETAKEYTSLNSIEHRLKSAAEFQELVDCFDVALLCYKHVKTYVKAKGVFQKMLDDEETISAEEMQGFSRDYGLSDL